MQREVSVLSTDSGRLAITSFQVVFIVTVVLQNNVTMSRQDALRKNFFEIGTLHSAEEVPVAVMALSKVSNQQ